MEQEQPVNPSSQPPPFVPDNRISDLLSEEVVPPVEEPTVEVNEDDFKVTDFGDGENGGAGTSENSHAAEPEPAPQPEPKKPEKKPDPLMTDSDKDRAVKRLMKPEVVLIFVDMMAKRAGRTFKPEYPDYFRFSAEDKEDFKTLLSHTIEEEEWENIPSKYMLGIGLLIWGGAKWYMWDKPHLWDGKAGILNDSKADKNHQSASMDQNEALMAYVREKAKEDAANSNRDLQEKLNRLTDQFIKQQRMTQNLMDMISGNVAPKGPEAEDVPYEEVPPERFIDEYDMEIIDFSPGGCIIDKTKCGLPGFTADGRKDGKPSRRDSEIQSHWEKYQAYKKKIFSAK